ncbi:hypothetical protein BDR03DRAFT_975701 [Suillus americanus]|nr:hypothetical protein BDR03DRAFT_975701 [Suillus americanus]
MLVKVNEIIANVLVLIGNPLVLIEKPLDLISHAPILFAHALDLISHALILSPGLRNLVLHRGQHHLKLAVHSHLRGIGCR